MTHGYWSSEGSLKTDCPGAHRNAPPSWAQRERSEAGQGDSLAASELELTFRNENLALQGPEAASSVGGGSVLSFYFPPRPYLPKQTAQASHPLHPRPRDRKQAVTAPCPLLPFGPQSSQASNATPRRSDWLRPSSAAHRSSNRGPGRESSRPRGRGERGFTCLWYLLRGA